MKNIIILGCPRSGTSMTAGLFKNSGLFMGDIADKPTDYSPKGSNEWRQVNDLNEMIIKKMLNDLPKPYDTYFLSSVPLGVSIQPDEEMVSKIKNLTNKPFIYKDPRFSYTLPVWKPYIKNGCYLVLFRRPEATMASMDRMAKGRYNLNLSKTDLAEIWLSYYQHILNQSDNKDWLFIHYDQIFNPEVLKKISEHTEINNLNTLFPEKSLIKEYERENIFECEDTYQKLCQLANYQEIK